MKIRAALDQAIGPPSGGYSAGLAQGYRILAVHIQELRQRVKDNWNSSSSIPRDGLGSVSYDQTNNRITTAGFAYDAAGNQTRALIPGSTASQRFQYDAANRLVKVKADDNVTVVATYTYGHSNERLIADEGGLRTYYVGGGGSTIAEYVESGGLTTPSWSKSYVYLGARLLSTLTPNGSGGETIQYHHPDRLGTRIVTNPADGTFFEQQTLPFGTALNESPPTGGISGDTNRRFTSYDRSQNTKLDYAVNRHYDSQQGRFTQVDPIGMGSVSLASPQTLNLYAYCGNDPINHIDPSGLGFFSKLFGVIAKIFKVVLVVAAVVLAVVGTLGVAGALLPFLSVTGGWIMLGLSAAGFAEAFGPPWLQKAIAVGFAALGIYMMQPSIIWNFAQAAGASHALVQALGVFTSIGAVSVFLQQQQLPGPKPQPAPEPERSGQKLSPCAKNILGAYFPDVNLDNLRIVEGIPWYVPMDAIGYTENRNIHFKKGYYDPFSTEGIALIGHEVTHASQQQHFGFDLKYGLKYLKNVATGGFSDAYDRISFEREANAMQDRIGKDLYKKFGNKNPCP